MELKAGNKKLLKPSLMFMFAGCWILFFKKEFSINRNFFEKHNNLKIFWLVKTKQKQKTYEGVVRLHVRKHARMHSTHMQKHMRMHVRTHMRAHAYAGTCALAYECAYARA